MARDVEIEYNTYVVWNVLFNNTAERAYSFFFGFKNKYEMYQIRDNK